MQIKLEKDYKIAKKNPEELLQIKSGEKLAQYMLLDKKQKELFYR